MGMWLEAIRGPQDLRELTPEQLQALCDELRQRVISVVSTNGGHLASNLGVVELTLALHRVFDFASDRLLWDVGHQCYVHKLLTGRAGRFATLRQRGGLSGFPSKAESEYDLFDVGHAGTSIPTALGLARADLALNENRRVVAVVGDASIVNGVAFEGLNQAGTLKRQFLVVLNDNSMGIARTQGGLAAYLARFRTSRYYEDLKRHVRGALARVPLVGRGVAEFLEAIKAGLKTTVSPHQMFEQLGFLYVGPVDGHDLAALTGLLTMLRDVQHPVLLHVHTEKGHGCPGAEQDPCAFHSPGKLALHGDRLEVVSSERPDWTSTFADAVVELAEADSRVYALTAAMPDGTGLARVRRVLPERVLDCGLAEGCTVDVAAGMARAGLRPLVCIYSTFLQRAFDQVFQEVVLQGLPVTFCLDRAGLVGGDGPVHHGFLDIAYLRAFQNMVLMAPADGPELLAALRYALTLTGPCAIRYPRDTVPAPLDTPLAAAPPFEQGKCRVMREGPDATLLAYGSMVAPALAAAEKLVADDIFVGVVNARFAKPLDDDMLTTALVRGRPVLTLEEHSVAGGFGSAVLEAANRLGLPTDGLVRLGLAENKFYAHGSRAEQLAEAGLDVAGILDAVRRTVRGHRAAADTAPALVPAIPGRATVPVPPPIE